MAGRMVSLARTTKERMGSLDGPSLLQGEDYPPGMCLTLTDSELEKLSLSDEGVEPNDMIHLMVMCTVQSVHKGPDGTRICMQVVGGRVENESAESEEDDEDEDDEAEDGED